MLETAATFFTHSLSACCARAPERAEELVASSRRQLLAIFLPLLAVGALLAGPAPSIFGSGYAAAADVLRLVLLGQAFRLLVVLVAVVLVPSAAGAATGADVAAVLLPVAWAYVAVQVGCALHVALVRLAGRARDPISGTGR